MENPAGHASTGQDNLGGLALSGGEVNVTQGDLLINNLDPIWLGFDVDEASTEASTIMFTNTAVHVDRTVAFTNERPYNFRVLGNAVVRNSMPGAATNRRATGFFATTAFEVPYVAIRTEAPDSIAKEVRVPIGADHVFVDGERVSMSHINAPAFISPEGRTMISTRYVAEALGLNINFANGTVVIMGSGGRIITFTQNEAAMVVSGTRIPIESAAVNINGRVFVPFRALADALNIPMEWNATTQEAIFNPKN